MRQPPTNVRYVVLFGLCLAAGLAYVHRGCLSVVESTVREDLDVTKGEMGWCFSAFFWAYALFQIPTGLLVDRWGPRRSLLLFGLIGAITMAMSALCIWTDAVTGFAILLGARLLMGIAQAGLFPASTRAMSTWIPLERRAFAGGGLQACMSLGGAIGAFTTARLLGVVAWPMIFAIYAVPGLIWSAWFFAWYRDRPDEHRSTNDAERQLLHVASVKSTVPAQHWYLALTSLPVILLCAQQFFRAGAAGFWFTWCPTYLQNALQQDKQSAGELTSIAIIGFMFGSVGGGLIADRLYRKTGSRRISRCGTAIAGSSAGVVCFVIAYFAGSVDVILGVLVLALAAFLAAWGNSCAYSVAMDLGGKNLAAVFGAMNMCGNFGAALFPVVATGWVDWLGWEKLVFLVAGGYLFGMLLWLPLRPDQTAQRGPVTP